MFRAELKRLGRKGKVRVNTLYTPYYSGCLESDRPWAVMKNLRPQNFNDLLCLVLIGVISSQWILRAETPGAAGRGQRRSDRYLDFAGPVLLQEEENERDERIDTGEFSNERITAVLSLYASNKV